MYSRDDLFMYPLECYFGVCFPRCFAINTKKVTLSWADTVRHSIHYSTCQNIEGDLSPKIRQEWVTTWKKFNEHVVTDSCLINQSWKETTGFGDPSLPIIIDNSTLDDGLSMTGVMVPRGVMLTALTPCPLQRCDCDFECVNFEHTLGLKS